MKRLNNERERRLTQRQMTGIKKTELFLWIPADSDSGSLIGWFDCFHGDRWVPQVKVSGQACPGSEPATHKPFKAKATKPADLRGLTPTPWLPLMREGGGREEKGGREGGERRGKREVRGQREEKNETRKRAGEEGEERRD